MTLFIFLICIGVLCYFLVRGGDKRTSEEKLNPTKEELEEFKAFVKDKQN